MTLPTNMTQKRNGLHDYIMVDRAQQNKGKTTENCSFVSECHTKEHNIHG